MCCLKIERTHDITTYFGVIFVSGHYNIVLSIDNELFLVPAIPLQVIPTWWVLFLVLAGNHHAVWGDAISILGWATQPDCWSNPFFLKHLFSVVRQGGLVKARTHPQNWICWHQILHFLLAFMPMQLKVLTLWIIHWSFLQQSQHHPVNWNRIALTKWTTPEMLSFFW